MSSYEVWLCDDAGRRLHLFPEFQYFSLAKLTKGFGYIEFGAPYDDYAKSIPEIFQPDWRLDVWRSPGPGVPTRREGSFMLRRYNINTREDGLRVLKLYGRSPLDIVRRQFVDSATDITLTDYADDMMKYLVTTYLLNVSSTYATVPSGEVTVDADFSNAPSVSETFSLNNLLDALKKIQENCETLNSQDPDTYPKVYFDMVENSTLVQNGFGYTFRTWTGLRGVDKTSGILFSEDNGNVKAVEYYEDYNDQITSEHIYNSDLPAANGIATSPSATLSRWNMCREAQSSSDASASVNLSKANSALAAGAAKKRLSATFINSPGSETQPRSLYGVDWDLGDLLPVKYGGKLYTTEVQAVYISMNQNGEEHISGFNRIGE